MSDLEKPSLNWDFKLDFDLPDAQQQKAAPPPPPPPRQVISEKFPRILDKIELLWATIELHQYLEHTLFSDRASRQGFPPEVMRALGEIHVEHVRILKIKGVIREDMWDAQFRK